MEDLKLIIAKNITNLRLEHGYTQFQLATILNYSDKAISKWERAESIPDITVLKEIADLFGVTVDYLLTLEHTSEQVIVTKENKISRSVIILLSLMLVWLIATLVFVTINLININDYAWLTFIYAIPVTSIVWLVLNTIWKNKKFNYFIISLLMWSTILSIHLSTIEIFDKSWLIYVLGAPGQIIILLWSKLVKKVK